MQKIAVISDTHWGSWDPADKLCARLHTVLQGYHEIWHAGDVVDESILLALEGIAPVTCVKGNCDSFMGRNLPHAVHRRIEQVNIGMIHGWDLPLGHTPTVVNRFPEGTALIIHGHTHTQRYEEYKADWGTCFVINPGSISQPRGGDTRGFGELVINGPSWSYRRQPLFPEAAPARQNN